jgi:hypothetical protein
MENNVIPIPQMQKCGTNAIRMKMLNNLEKKVSL